MAGGRGRAHGERCPAKGGFQEGLRESSQAARGGGGPRQGALRNGRREGLLRHREYRPRHGALRDGRGQEEGCRGQAQGVRRGGTDGEAPGQGCSGHGAPRPDAAQGPVGQGESGHVEPGQGRSLLRQGGVGGPETRGTGDEERQSFRSPASTAPSSPAPASGGSATRTSSASAASTSTTPGARRERGSAGRRPSVSSWR